MVSKNEKKERLLYSTVRGSEYERQQKKRAVSELERRLLAARAVNHRHLIQQQSRCSKAEQQLGQKLSREQAELSKVKLMCTPPYRSLTAYCHRDETLGWLFQCMTAVCRCLCVFDLDDTTQAPSGDIQEIGGWPDLPQLFCGFMILMKFH